MTESIDYAELQNLLEDDKTPDQVLAPYFRSSPTLQPMTPRLRINEELVQVPERRGILGVTVGLLNRRAQRRRAAKYSDKIAQGFTGPRLIAEGDSWFQYPILREDVIDSLDDEFAIYCTSAAGDTLENMTSGVEDLERRIAELEPHGLLFSGGANDIAGEPLVGYLLDGTPGRNISTDFLSPAYARFLKRLEDQLTDFFGRITGRFSGLPIFCHGYDWPFTRQDGRWLHPAMEERAIPEDLQTEILKDMIDRYYGVLERVADKSTGRIVIVDCRGAIGDRAEWYDELHPWDAGFARVADRFRDAVQREVQSRSARSMAVSSTTITWFPREDEHGVRRRDKNFPVGAMVSVGRHNRREIVLDDEHVSRQHARFEILPNGILVEDLGSTNGTFLEGERIKSALWQPDQTLEIGIFRFELELLTETPDAKVILPELSTVNSDLAPLADFGVPDSLADRAEQSTYLRQLEIELIAGNLVNVQSPAYAIGIFEHVKPSGVAREIDELSGHRLSALIQARFFGCHQGEISSLPTPEQQSFTKMIVFAGLGTIGSFHAGVLETVGENLARFVTLQKFRAVATVPIGMSTGCSVADFTNHFLDGFLSGLTSGDPHKVFLSLQICEIDRERYNEIAREIENLLKAGFFAARGFDVLLQKSTVSDLSYSDHGGEGRAEIDPIYLEASSPAPGCFEYWLLTPEHGAAMKTWAKNIDQNANAQIIETLARTHTFDVELGAHLANHYLPAELQKLIGHSLDRSANGHLVVIHDEEASTIPWEALYIENECPALHGGVSRVYKTTRSERARGQTRLPRDALLHMLVIQDPTSDLKGAFNEGVQLAELFRMQSCDVRVLSRDEATRENILGELTSQRYDILHYAGHADFDEDDPSNSGLLCHDGRLVASDLRDMMKTPQLVFLNGCESGRLRSPDDIGQTRNSFHALIANVSFAEGLLMKGVPNFIGTFWPVNDTAALQFARSFYQSLLDGEPIGLAMRDGRQAARDVADRDWANYQHFGNESYRLRQP